MSGPAARDDDAEDRVPALARARTELAWTRTAVSFAALGAAVLRTGAVVSLLVMALGAAVCVVGYVSARPSRHGAGPLSAGRSAALLTLATTLVAVLALVAAVSTATRGHG